MIKLLTGKKVNIIKKLRLIITNTAEHDLRGIYDKITEDNQEVAAQFVADLLHKIRELARLGVTGSPRDYIRLGLRAFPYRVRCFYFRIVEDKMIVTRILHGKQDVTAQAFPED